MKVCVLVSAYRKTKEKAVQVNKKESPNLTYSENENPDDPSGACIAALTELDDYDRTPAHFFEDSTEYIFETVQLYKSTSYRDIRALVHSKQYDCFFVLCDGAKDEDRAGEDVLRALEEFNVPYTGADLNHYDPSKLEMKMQAFYSNILVPEWSVFRCGFSGRDELTKNLSHLDLLNQRISHPSSEDLKYPMIVKHPHGFNSVGMTKDSKCFTVSELETQVNKMVENFHSALVERFIEGEEVTVLALQTTDGTKVLPPVKMRFSEGEDFKHFDLKWRSYDDIEWIPMDIDDPAYEEVMRIGKEAFDVMLGGVGIARSDLRICRRENKVYFLEINPNPGIMYPPGAEGSADWILRYNSHCFGHREATIALIEAALLVHKKKQSNFVIDFKPDVGYHCVAAKDIRKGETVFKREGEEVTVCTKRFLSKYNEFYSDQFARSFTWPLSPDEHIFAVRDAHYKKWTPLVHCCDPNLTFDAGHSLDIVACKPISKGQIMAIDHATFCSTKERIPCKCGSLSCRGFIFYDEHIQKKYGRNTFLRPIKSSLSA